VSFRAKAQCALTKAAAGPPNTWMGPFHSDGLAVAVPDLTTTVLTLTLTGLAADSLVAGGDNPRIGRRVASVSLMFAGAAVGTLLLRRGRALPLVVGAVGGLAATVAYADVPTPPPAAGRHRDEPAVQDHAG
jgi:hypothetical protein